MRGDAALIEHWRRRDLDSGEGRSTIGEQRFEWSRHDVFSVPHWTWASHEARSAAADLLVVTDRAIYERLDLLKEELR